MTKRARISSTICVLAGWLISAQLGAAATCDLYPDGEPRTFDEDLLCIAQEVPGFGGLFYDEGGVFNVWIVGADVLAAGEQDNVTEAIVERVGAIWGHEFWSQGRGLRDEDLLSEPFGVPPIRLLPARYELGDLLKWRSLANEAFAIPEVVMTDLDEAANRVRVGVYPGSDPEALLAFLASRGVPGEAVLVEEVQPRTPGQGGPTVGSDAWPIEGGRFLGLPGGNCTLSYPLFDRDGTRGFVTNTHCSSVHGQPDGTPYRQRSGTPVGTERRDPAFTSAGCTPGFVCRWSDANFVRYTASALFDPGRISRTTNWRGSRQINLSNPTFRVIGTNVVAVGNWVDKVGSTTGWTYGYLKDTCLDFAWGYGLSRSTLKCSHRVQGYGDVPGNLSDLGDSGSPAFSLLNPTAAGRVWIVGVVHSIGSSEFIYSPMSGLRIDRVLLPGQEVPDPEAPDPEDECADYPYCP